MDRSHEVRRSLWLGLTLCLVIFASFWPVLHSQFINFDDPEYVTENPRVLTGLTWQNFTWAFQTGYAGNWHPLTWISHMLDAQLFALNPMGHHFTNLFFHALNAILLFLLLRQLTQTFWPSVVVAALFALHPLHVESVAWVSERKDVLSGFFFLLTLWAYATYVQRRDPTSEVVLGPTQKFLLPAWSFYLLSLLLFACGLMSKPMLVTLPCILLLLDYWPLQRFAFSKNSEPASKAKTHSSTLTTGRVLLVEKVPFLALAAAASMVTFWVQRKQGAVTSLSGLPLESRVANAFAACIRYIGKTIWPTNLAIFYPHPDTTYPVSQQWPAWQILAAALVLILASFLALKLARSHPFLTVGWFWFLVMLLPVIGIIQVGAQAMADRYTYLPLIGLFLALTWGACAMWSHSRFVPILPVTAILACALLTWFQARRWHDSITLFEHTLAVTSHNPTAHFNLGAAYEAKAQFGLAMTHYRAALQLDPNHPDALYNLGHALAAQGKLTEAVAYYEAVLSIKPDHADAHNNLGNAFYGLGKPAQAAAHYREGIRLQPDFAACHNNLGKVLTDQGQLPQARAQFLEAVRLKPDFFEAHAGLALVWGMEGQFAQSLERWQSALKLRPNNAEVHFNLGHVLTELGRQQEANAQYAEARRLQPDLAQQNLQLAKTLEQKGLIEPAQARLLAALRLQPDYAEAHERLGMLLAQQQRFGEAIEHFEQALRLRPDAQAHYNLAMALAISGKPEQAAGHYEAALTLRPDWLAALNNLAWLRATHPSKAVRNGAEATRLAKRACELNPDESRYWGTLDAAYAELGQFDNATATAKKTLELAQAQGLKEVAEAAHQRLQLYQLKQPFREKAAEPGGPK